MTYRFCPRCGGTLESRRLPGDHLDRQVCTACGSIMYENSKPCAGALVTRAGKVLLARRAVEPAIGAWDVPGGFLENGEHPYDGAIRELREETGVEIRPTHLLGIWMDRYDEATPWTLNVYYLAEVERGEPRPADDVAELAWFGVDELPEELAFSHEREVLEAWKAYRSRKS